MAENKDSQLISCTTNLWVVSRKRNPDLGKFESFTTCSKQCHPFLQREASSSLYWTLRTFAPCFWGRPYLFISLLICWAIWMPPQLNSGLPPEERHPKREQGRSCNFFYNSSLDVTLCHFHNILLLTQVSPSHCGRRLHKGINTR